MFRAMACTLLHVHLVLFFLNRGIYIYIYISVLGFDPYQSGSILSLCYPATLALTRKQKRKTYKVLVSIFGSWWNNKGALKMWGDNNRIQDKQLRILILSVVLISISFFKKNYLVFVAEHILIFGYQHGFKYYGFFIFFEKPIQSDFKEIFYFT